MYTRTSPLFHDSATGNALQETNSRAVAPGTSSTGIPLPPGPAGLGAELSADQLVLEFMGLADALSRRYRAPACEAEDLQQVARLGLVKAARRYREAGNHGFIAFAVPTITGELKRHLRDHCWVVRPPRPVQEARLRIRHVRPELTQCLGRDPSTAELSSASGISVMDTTLALLAEMSMVTQQIQQNDTEASYEGRGLDVILAVDDPGFERINQELTVEAVLWDASVEDKRLLHLRFVLELSQGQIAQEFGVSQMQISRQLKQLLDRLGRRLTEPAKQ
ncbi:sigma-70 family RNA polymerase sigma factor [Arthrobacter sp. GMC3]|uniref:sigma-70 family RNA polymerase sigma factor n=1 Tax=Arthrobacter sp. GMC3 TaxID=2058894 RepID=UPI0011B0EDF5|nr:sigma-70 family RNA polymerase sigma factor [Arthrobacter sp. GMC3]